MLQIDSGKQRSSKECLELLHAVKQSRGSPQHILVEEETSTEIMLSSAIMTACQRSSKNSVFAATIKASENICLSEAYQSFEVPPKSSGGKHTTRTLSPTDEILEEQHPLSNSRCNPPDSSLPANKVRRSATTFTGYNGKNRGSKRFRSHFAYKEATLCSAHNLRSIEPNREGKGTT